MTRIQRYRFHRLLQSSSWLLPLLAMAAAVVLHQLLWWLDARTRWAWAGFSPDGARGIVGVIATSMLTFMVFTYSMILLGVQIAGAQLSPRVIDVVMKDRVLKWCLGLFVFAFTYSACVLGRIEDVVPQLPMVMVSLGCLLSISAFLYLVDYMMRILRPAGILVRVAAVATSVIEDIYPYPLAESERVRSEQSSLPVGEASRTVCHRGSSGVLQGLDGRGLMEIAHRNRCTIRLAQQVGDFVTKDEPLIHIYDGGQGVDDDELHQSVALGMERTMQQDPTLAFRIIVDIASRALSPAINDPSTAVLALDQIHRLLRIVGKRYLGDGTLRDEEGVVRLILPTPNWEDFVSLGMSEIRLFGGSSLQIVRRLRAMIENLLAVLPEQRHPALHEQLKLLDRAVERNFADPVDRAYAGMSDYQGVGSSRLAPSAGGPREES